MQEIGEKVDGGRFSQSYRCPAALATCRGTVAWFSPTPAGFGGGGRLLACPLLLDGHEGELYGAEVLHGHDHVVHHFHLVAVQRQQALETDQRPWIGFEGFFLFGINELAAF